MTSAIILRSLFAMAALMGAVPASGQVRPTANAMTAMDDENEGQEAAPQQQTPLDTNPTGRTARSSVGQAGQRQTREAAAEQAGIKPMARIASRIQNRVQNRIRNRIDRNYDPQAGATDPFAVAEDQARTTGRPR